MLKIIKAKLIKDMFPFDKYGLTELMVKNL